MAGLILLGCAQFDLDRESDADSIAFETRFSRRSAARGMLPKVAVALQEKGIRTRLHDRGNDNVELKCFLGPARSVHFVSGFKPGTVEVPEFILHVYGFMDGRDSSADGLSKFMEEWKVIQAIAQDAVLNGGFGVVKVTWLSPEEVDAREAKRRVASQK